VFLVAMTVGVVIVLERLVGLRRIVGTST
jgi:hypothetical protein